MEEIFKYTKDGWKVHTSPKASLPGVFLSKQAAERAYRTYLIQAEQAKLKRDSRKQKD